MTRTRCCWHGMLKVKATVTSVSKRMEALISNVHTTHKDSKLLMRTSTDVLFVIGLVPWTLISSAIVDLVLLRKHRRWR